MKKKKEKNASNSIGRYLLRIWIVVAASALIIAVCFAAYTSMNSVKRVVSTDKGEGLLFSSNYLAAYGKDDSKYTTKIITVSNSEDPSVTISVCNYAQENVTKANPYDITYTFQVTLIPKDGFTIKTDSDGNVSGYSLKYGDQKSGVFKKSGNDYTCSIEGEQLKGETSNKNTYDIYVSKKDMDNIYIQIEAIPKDYRYTDNKKLANILSTTLNGSTQNTGWTGQFTDIQTDRTPEDYDGFNYQVSGNGYGKLTITWNCEKIEISPWFLEGRDLTKDTEKNTKSISFKVGEDNVESYAIQFYWVEKENIDWTTLEEYVSCEFVESGN